MHEVLVHKKNYKIPQDSSEMERFGAVSCLIQILNLAIYRVFQEE
jgi:hypothetical protein